MSPGGEQIRTELVRKGKTWKLDKKLCNLNLDELDPQVRFCRFLPLPSVKCQCSCQEDKHSVKNFELLSVLSLKICSILEILLNCLSVPFI